MQVPSRKDAAMDALMISAASGMQARMQSLETLANNIANSGTTGFKADREFYNLYVSPDALNAAAEGGQPEASTIPVVEKQYTDFTQSLTFPTGNPLDVAIEGSGFFVARGSSGPLYTRNGNFRLSKDGQLQTEQGYAVEDDQGRPIQLDPTQAVEITKDGVVRQQGQDIAQLGVVDFRDHAALAKRDGTYFVVADTGKGQATQVTSPSLEQGSLENSNVPAAEAAVRLVNVMRQFDMLQRAVTLGTQMDRSITDIGKTTS